MKYLKSLELTNFKGIRELRCQFDDVTVLAGLNNSGKTSVLQAVYLLTTLLPVMAQHRRVYDSNENTRAVSLPLEALGIPSWDWVAPESDEAWAIRGELWNGLRAEVWAMRRGTFLFTLTRGGQILDRETDAESLADLVSISADFFRPPGTLSPSETMLPGQQYQVEVGRGRGGQFFRNGIFWNLQTAGIESFTAVQEEVARRFPGVELLLPTLQALGNPPPIRILYREDGGGALDVAQSGAGLHTYLSLAQVLRQSACKIVLLDEPDTHLHAAQQAMVMDQLLEVADEQDRQILVATHSGEMLSCVPDESVRWLERGSQEATGGADRADYLERLGVQAHDAVAPEELPDVIVYVEGQTDKRVLGHLLNWARTRIDDLPSTQVVAHRHGKFGATTLHGIARTVQTLRRGTRVVGVRDLDRDFNGMDLPPSAELKTERGAGWTLITLPCKELENAPCNEDLILGVVSAGIERADLSAIISEEMRRPTLIDELRFAALPQIRGRHDPKLDGSTSEKQAAAEFDRWLEDPSLIRRLVAGKSLMRSVRRRLQGRGVRLPGGNHFARLESVPHPWREILAEVFPGRMPAS